MPWPSPWVLLAVFVVALLTRIPFIGAGYGLDPDSHRVVMAARKIASEGGYEASRLPGYPVHEYLVAVTPAKYEPLVSNALTAVFSALAVVFFALIARHLNIRHYLLLTAAFALTPIIYVHSTDTMDYMIALAFVMAATYFTVTRKPTLAGAMLGLAIGARLTSGAMLVPLSLWTILSTDSLGAWRKPMARLWISTAIVGAVCFAPVLMRYGAGFWWFADSLPYPTLPALLDRALLQVWGRLGLLGLTGSAAALMFVWRLRRPMAASELPSAALCLSAVLIYLAAFLRLPIEAAYLIPIVPFILILVGLLADLRLQRILAIAIIASPFVTVSRYGPSLDGPMLTHYEQRLRHQKEIADAVDLMAELPTDAVIVAGWKRPAFVRELDTTPHRPEVLEFVRTSNLPSVEGRPVYYLPGMDEYNLYGGGIDLARFDGQQIPQE